MELKKRLTPRCLRKPWSSPDPLKFTFCSRSSVWPSARKPFQPLSRTTELKRLPSSLFTTNRNTGSDHQPAAGTPSVAGLQRNAAGDWSTSIRPAEDLSQSPSKLIFSKHFLWALHQVGARKDGAGNDTARCEVHRPIASSERPFGPRLLTEGEAVLVDVPHGSSFVPDVPHLRKHKSNKDAQY